VISTKTNIFENENKIFSQTFSTNFHFFSRKNHIFQIFLIFSKFLWFFWIFNKTKKNTHFYFYFYFFRDFYEFLVQNLEISFFLLWDHKMSSFWRNQEAIRLILIRKRDHDFQDIIVTQKWQVQTRIASWFREKPCPKPGPEHLGSEGYPLHNLLKITWFPSWDTWFPRKWP
jgi:hypothetical protein